MKLTNSLAVDITDIVTQHRLHSTISVSHIVQCALCNMCLNSLAPSAYKSDPALQFSTKSLTYITNNSGLKTEPCGMQLKTVAYDQKESFICTLCLLLVIIILWISVVILEKK